MAAQHKKQVAIIGGGCAGMAAAWELTSGENTGAFDVTTSFRWAVASEARAQAARNEALGYRIEEHGLHLWLGYYENAFRMVRSCFTELQTLAPHSIADAELQPHLLSRPFDDWNWLSALKGKPRGTRRRFDRRLATLGCEDFRSTCPPVRERRDRHLRQWRTTAGPHPAFTWSTTGG